MSGLHRILQYGFSSSISICPIIREILLKPEAEVSLTKGTFVGVL